MEVDILKVASLFAVFQSFIWILYLIFHKKGILEQRILIITLFLAFGLFVLGSMLLVYGNTPLTYRISNLTSLTVFLLLPVFYLYILSRNTKPALQKHKYIFHFLPFIVILGYNFYIFFLQNNPVSDYDFYAKALIGVFYVQNIVYLYLIFRIIYPNGLVKQNFLRNHKETEIDWIKSFFLGLLVIVILKVSIFTTWSFYKNLEFCIIVSSIFFITSFILINFLILHTLLKQNAIVTVEKYQNSHNSDQIQSCYNELQAFLISAKIYLDPLLSLDKLSKKLRVSSKLLSQTINEKYGKNYNEVINSYRIEAAKLLLRSTSENINVLDVAYEVGFNSKSTFNTSFKNITGFTPSQFKKNFKEAQMLLKTEIKTE